MIRKRNYPLVNKTQPGRTQEKNVKRKTFFNPKEITEIKRIQQKGTNTEDRQTTSNMLIKKNKAKDQNKC